MRGERGKFVQGERRSQTCLDYAEPPPNLRKCVAFAKGKS